MRRHDRANGNGAAWPRAVVLCLVSVSVRAQTVQYEQRTEPLGLFGQVEDVLVGTSVSTTNAPMTTGGYRFHSWSLNTVTNRDELGRTRNPVAFRIIESTVAVAHYLDASLDSNTNDIRDWWEFSYQPGLSTNVNADGDGDGFTFLDEYRQDLHPAVVDRIHDGGFTVGFSPQTYLFFRTNVVVPDSNEVYYVERSDPEGLIPTVDVITNKGLVMAYGDLRDMSDTHRFGCWTVNGTVQTDTLGRAAAAFSLELVTNTTVTAHFRTETQDVDGDGLRDWQELNYLGTTNYAADADPDGDGHTLADELPYAYHPAIPDRIRDGSYTVGFSRGTRVIANTNLAVFAVRSDPLGIVGSTETITATGTNITLRDVSALGGDARFVYWSVNGTIQADALGQGLDSPTFTFLSNAVAEARFVPRADDLDEDGLADWLEWRYLSGTNQGVNANSDGDTFTLEEELRYDLHPVIPDRIHDGGYAVSFAGIDPPNTNPPQVLYTQRSIPPLLVETTVRQVDIHSTVHVPNAFGFPGSLAFCYWTLNGTIQTNGLGAAANTFDFTIATNTMAVAHFIDASRDDDSDDLPDWWELNRLMTTNASPTSDWDADGFTVGEEYRYHFHSGIRDRVRDGGYLVSMSRTMRLDFQFFPRVTESLVDGVPRQFFTINTSTTGTFSIAANSHPAVGDWDGDGDLDLFVGGRHPSTGSGQVRVFENAGSPQVMNLVERTTNFAGVATAWAGITNPAPALGDWTGDGIADLAIGGETGVVELVGSTLRFSPPQVSGFRFQVSVGSGVVIPAFGDVDGDGWQDLLVLGEDGRVRFFPHTRSPALPYANTPASADLLKSAVPNATAITTADVNEDGVTDVLISDDNGNVWEFHGGD